MEIKKSLLSAVAGAALVAFAGGAHAAGDNDANSPGTMNPSTSNPSASSPSPSVAPPNSGATMPATPSDRSGSLGAEQAGKPAAPPGFIVGKDVVNAAGEEIGTVSKIDGNQVIVSVGGFLGIGSHDVALSWDQLQLSGTGDQAEVSTTLSKGELKAMPEYEASETGTPTGSMRSAPSGSERR